MITILMFMELLIMILVLIPAVISFVKVRKLWIKDKKTPLHLLVIIFFVVWMIEFAILCSKK